MFRTIADFTQAWQGERENTLKIMRALTDASLAQRVDNALQCCPICFADDPDGSHAAALMIMGKVVLTRVAPVVSVFLAQPAPSGMETVKIRIINRPSAFDTTPGREYLSNCLNLGTIFSPH